MVDPNQACLKNLMIVLSLLLRLLRRWRLRQAEGLAPPSGVTPYASSCTLAQHVASQCSVANFEPNLKHESCSDTQWELSAECYLKIPFCSLDHWLACETDLL